MSISLDGVIRRTYQGFASFWPRQADNNSDRSRRSSLSAELVECNAIAG